MSWGRVWTVANLELTQRRRTSKWPWVLGAWFVLVGTVTYFGWKALSDANIKSGASLYDVTTFLVLGLAMMVMPALTATSINGDREHGVLATLQTTMITARELVLGKLLAAWLTALAFVVTALPFLAFAWVQGGVDAWTVVRSLGALLVVLASLCAIGLMFSTLFARPVASAVVTYVAMAALAVGTVIAMLVGYALTTNTESVQVRSLNESFWMNSQPPVDAGPDWQPPNPTAADCVVAPQEREIGHTERVWWVLAPNPFIFVADAAPSQTPTSAEVYFPAPMRFISDGARSARRGDTTEGIIDECTNMFGNFTEAMETERLAKERAALRDYPVWPANLAFFLLAGAGALIVAERRVRTPVSRLPNGTRIA